MVLRRQTNLPSILLALQSRRLVISADKRASARKPINYNPSSARQPVAASDINSYHPAAITQGHFTCQLNTQTIQSQVHILDVVSKYMTVSRLMVAYRLCLVFG